MKKLIIICLLFCSYIVLAFSPAMEGKLLQNNSKKSDLLTAEQIKAVEDHKALEVKYNVKRGHRPEFDLADIPEDAYEKGKLQIKLMPFMHKSMDSEYLYADKEEGFVKTGNPQIDAINKSIGATKYYRPQDALYRVSPVSEKFRERHEAWGAHLWREITFDSRVDVIEAVKKFQSLVEVEIAEPIFIKKIIEPVDISPVLNQNGDKWTPNDPLYAANQWHFNNTGQDIGGQIGTVGWDCNAEAAWDIETGNPNFIVAIIDQGVDFVHEDIADNMWPTIGPEGTGTVAGDHGTHVAGTISAVSNNGIGIPGLSGGDGSGNGTMIMSINLWGSTGMTTLQMNQYAADNGASISQNSWGYGSAGYYDQSDLDGIDYFNANGGGTGLIGGITIFAAGNDNDNADWYPAYYGYGDPGTMGAMAVASHDNQGVKSGFSNYGAWIDITAPGTNVASLAPTDGYAFMSGTSMACPHVSGVAAMIVSNTEGVLTNAELWDIIVNSVRIDLYDVNTGYVGDLGIGALDAAAALEEAQTYLGGVPTADNFLAVGVSETQIDLSWILNAYNDDVMIAWALQGNEIGTPVNGTVYNVGNAIPGGGTVLYNGNAISTSHTGLDAATGYSYKIWAKAGEDRQDDQGEWYLQGDYSTAKSASAQTDCGTISTFPFNEGFEGGGLPNCWSYDGTPWAYQSGGQSGNPVAAHTGSYNAMFYHASTAADVSKLITPQFDFTGYGDATLNFWHAQVDWAGDIDELRIYYKTSSGGAWTMLEEYVGEIASWTEKNIVLPDLSNDYYIAFEATGQYGYGVVLDDISITANSSVLLGDVNNDGIINVIDIVWLVNYLLGNPDPAFVIEAADVNQDTFIDISDVVAISSIIMGGAKDFEQINSEVAYVSVENGTLELESDGTLTALQFKLVADNASDLDLNLLTDSHKLSYAVKDNVLTGLIYSLDNNAFPDGITKLLSIENLNSFSYKQLIASNINAESIEVLPKDATLTEEFTVEELELSVFPNPNAGNFTVALELPSDAVVELQLYDVTGRKVFDIQPSLYTKGLNHIEINNDINLERGFYILRVNGFDLNNSNLLFRNEIKLMIGK